MKMLTDDLFIQPKTFLKREIILSSAPGLEAYQ